MSLSSNDMQASISSEQSGMAGFEDILLNNRNRMRLITQVTQI